jgi:hypothetical protein
MAATDGRVAGILDEHSAAIGVVFVEDRGDRRSRRHVGRETCGGGMTSAGPATVAARCVSEAVPTP